MTVIELLKHGINLLKEKNIENFNNEARWIFESVFECKSDYVVFHGEDIADEAKADDFLSEIRKRAEGMPVQYVIGSWDFYGERFYVGEGVLIPRPETEILVDFAIEYLKDKKNPVVVDLCAGTGCVGLSVAKNCPDANVILVEKYAEAFSYLKKNLVSFGVKNAKIINGDIFDGFDKFDFIHADLILSNPPYIDSADICGLQDEVQKEPVTALDGGADGYDFYRAIAEKWLPCCDAVAVECGEGQAEYIQSLFSKSFSETYSVNDFNGISRVVIGKERK